MKTIKKILFSLISLLLFSTLFWGYNRKNSSKNFIIENVDRIEVLDSDYYEIDSLKGYYTDVTIKFKSDSSYTVIYWGDRNSWLWDFKSDYFYTVDVPYNRSKGIDVSKDIKLLNVIKDIK